MNPTPTQRDLVLTSAIMNIINGPADCTMDRIISMISELRFFSPDVVLNDG